MKQSTIFMDSNCMAAGAAQQVYTGAVAGPVQWGAGDLQTAGGQQEPGDENIAMNVAY